ncbi:uncharacterized protein LOC110693793 [Chenopodium quinoa]|uniref:uncharacterized protein LOC110693793 n=1 Tax=Chenopodium quinoa TaxID=63459 RepID=UPI000B799099|nr:uncharacterized protein LOC110693793 [Chenopodium quinoa]
MSGEFEMSMMGELNYFLGLQIKQTEEGIMIHQQKYIKELIKKYKLDNAKTNNTLMGIATRLDEDLTRTCVDQSMYRGMIGSLLYLTASRPDISFSVGLCARFQANPKESHLKAVKRILRYLKGTDDLSLFYPRSDSFDLNCFTYANYAGDLVDRKSTSGMVQFLGPCLVSWGSKKQNTVAMSTAEAEYVTAAACCSQVLWIKQQNTMVIIAEIVSSENSQSSENTIQEETSPLAMVNYKPSSTLTKTPENPKTSSSKPKEMESKNDQEESSVSSVLQRLKEW